MIDKYADKRPTPPRLPNIRRMHFLGNGKPKAKYGVATAKKIAKELGIDAYRCPICHSMHVGHWSGDPR